jgi:mRNA interferase MazF
VDRRRREHYAGKPRPVVVVQDDRFDATESVTICPLTTDPTEIPLLRIPLDAGAHGRSLRSPPR